MQILKVIGLLMEYPDELLWECKEDALALIRRDAPMLTDFTHNLLNAPLLDKQAEWCEVFDRGRTTSLLLFEHVHAESRDRGQAMVDLLAEYEKVGLQLDCRELPDYLPLYLEYLSVLPDDQANRTRKFVSPTVPAVTVAGSSTISTACGAVRIKLSLWMFISLAARQRLPPRCTALQWRSACWSRKFTPVGRVNWMNNRRRSCMVIWCSRCA